MKIYRPGFTVVLSRFVKDAHVFAGLRESVVGEELGMFFWEKRELFVSGFLLRCFTSHLFFVSRCLVAAEYEECYCS
ncbi:MAG TPA: hypothetical protein O0X38_02840, partial [Methanocorpusculum sp.]|nr:hypothetical protein [Methanocorpusculum sp.]